MREWGGIYRVLTEKREVWGGGRGGGGGGGPKCKHSAGCSSIGMRQIIEKLTDLPSV